jgi:hypothetical protein
VVAPAAVADIACAAAGFAAGLLDPQERSEEDADEEVGACAGEASSWNGFRIKGCGGGGVTGAAAAVPRPGARARPSPRRPAPAVVVRSLFLERALRFWNQ